MVFVDKCEFFEICSYSDEESKLCLLKTKRAFTENEQKIRYACSHYHYLKAGFKNSPKYRMGSGSINDQYEFNK